MLTKFFAVVAFASVVVAGGVGYANQRNATQSECCFPGSPCCELKLPCCTDATFDCCYVGSPCCYEGSPCCEATQQSVAAQVKATVKAKKASCCGVGAPCCEAGEPCCTK